jgi:hypothetical protein
MQVAGRGAGRAAWFSGMDLFGSSIRHSLLVVPFSRRRTLRQTQAQTNAQGGIPGLCV